MISLHIDFETFSYTDISAGVYAYAQRAEILLAAYAYNDEPVDVIDCTKDSIPYYILDDLLNPNVKKKAFNAAFEIGIIEACLNIKMDLSQWECTQHRAAMCGLPLSLDQTAKVLAVNHQKDRMGSSLINYFCIPVKKPIRKNDFRERNLPEHDLVKWDQFKTYNAKDVEAERAVGKQLAFYNIPPFERRVWELDQEINNRGIGINIPFVRSAIKHINFYEDRLLQEAKKLTNLDNPNSLSQLKQWLFEETNEDITKLTKDTIPDIIKKSDSELVTRVLEIRQEASKTSTKKYPRMLQCLARDGRIHGVHQCYGANRTGRAAARMIQTHNLPRGTFSNIEPVRDVVMKGDPSWLEFVYEAIPNTLSQLIRSSLVPSPGKRFIISDFSAIEARVLAWLAGEEWVLEVFRTHGKIYEATAAKIFSMPLEAITKDSPYRQKGKVAALALGYQGADGALIKMGAIREGLTEEELPVIVKGYREASPNTVMFWYALQSAAMTCVRTGSKIYLHTVVVSNKEGVYYQAPNKGVSFHMKGRSMILTLPSGRELVYVNAGIGDGKYGDVVTYWGINQTKGRWMLDDTYGGKLAENITQAVARDLLMCGLQNVDSTGYDIVLHVHDEVVCEMPIGKGSLDEVNHLMTILPNWATGLPLKAEGCESLYYKK